MDMLKLISSADTPDEVAMLLAAMGQTDKGKMAPDPVKEKKKDPVDMIASAGSPDVINLLLQAMGQTGAMASTSLFQAPTKPINRRMIS